MGFYHIYIIGPKNSGKSTLVLQFKNEKKVKECHPYQLDTLTITERFIANKNNLLPKEGNFEDYFKAKDIIYFHECGDDKSSPMLNGEIVSTFSLGANEIKYSSGYEYINDRNAFKPEVLVIVLNLNPNFEYVETPEYEKENEKKKKREVTTAESHSDYLDRIPSAMHEIHMNYLNGLYERRPDFAGIPVILVAGYVDALDNFKIGPRYENIEKSSLIKERIKNDFKSIPEQLQSEGKNIINAYCPDMKYPRAEDQETFVKIFGEAAKAISVIVKQNVVEQNGLPENKIKLKSLQPTLTSRLKNVVLAPVLIVSYAMLGIFSAAIPLTLKYLGAVPDMIFNHTLAGGASFCIATLIIASILISMELHKPKAKDKVRSKSIPPTIRNSTRSRQLPPVSHPALTSSRARSLGEESVASVTQGEKQQNASPQPDQLNQRIK